MGWQQRAAHNPKSTDCAIHSDSGFSRVVYTQAVALVTPSMDRPRDTMRQIDAIKIYQKKSCLIIDDMNEVRGSLKRMLMTFGMSTIDTAATSKLAIDMCEQRDYDLVLCDYNLGDGQDGQQVLESLRFTKYLKNTSMFLMITAETSREMVLGALEYLPDDYLTKPITQAMLQNRLGRIIERHEDLYEIKHAIDQQDLEQAIVLCQQKLDGNGKYSGSYKRIKAELLYRLERFEEAQAIYLEAIKDKNPVWAQLGLGKTYLAKKEYTSAEKLLKSVIDADERYVEAHDLLAQVHSEQADYQKAQAAMERATTVSPKSVLRQRRLADMAKLNNDRAARIAARRQALKIGEHSCYYSAQDYFDVVSDLLEEDPEMDVDSRLKNARDAKMYLGRAEKKHPDEAGIKLQLTAARSRLAKYQNHTQEAAKLLAEAKALHDKGSDSALAELELAQAMADNGDKEGAEKLYRKVAAEHPDNDDVANRVDALSDEPLSQKGRKVAADLTRQGIDLYQKQSYDEAIKVFERAISLFPNHIGLRLNITQAALAKAKDEQTNELKILCYQHLDSIGDISKEHKQYARHQHLIKQSNALFN